MVLEFLNVIRTILEFLKKSMERVHFSGKVPFIFLEILMLHIELEKIIKSYTYIHFSREHYSFFYLRFSIFHFNQTRHKSKHITTLKHLSVYYYGAIDSLKLLSNNKIYIINFGIFFKKMVKIFLKIF